MKTKTYLDVRFDITDLTDEERGHLAGEVITQHEPSDGRHPGVPYPEVEWNDVEVEDEPEDEPVHRPAAPDAPIPGVHHFAGCDPDHPTVSPEGVCRGCGETACPTCGYGDPCVCEPKVQAVSG